MCEPFRAYSSVKKEGGRSEIGARDELPEKLTDAWRHAIISIDLI